MRRKLYRQCKLKKGNVIQSCWIDNDLAVSNKILRIKKDDGSWDDGWKVIDVYFTFDYDKVLIVKDQYKHTREVSDI